MGCIPSARHFAVLLLFLLLLLQGDGRMYNTVAVPSALVVGTLYCDTCSDQQSNKLGHFIPGASVEVECKDESKHTAFRKTAITDIKGLFKFNMPPEVHKNIQSIKNCTFGLVKASHPTFCDAVASTATTSAIELHPKSTRKDGIKVYSAGTVTLKPQKKPAACDEEIDQPAFFFLPPNPLQPPNIVGIPIPQNPLVPPPLSLLPPGLQPATPSISPPGLPLFPSPSSQKLLPPLPILEPPPSSPSPGLPILPPGLPLVPPGLPLIPPGLPLIPPGLPIPPSFPLDKKDSP